MRTFFLQLTTDENKFENVDQHVFDNRRFALATDGQPRYTENYFTFNGQNVEIHCENISALMIAGISRMLGNGLNAAGVGRYDEPDCINFRKGRSEYLYQIEAGTKWKKAA